MPASWTTPADHVTGYTVTAPDWNSFNGTNGDMAFLYGDTGWTTISVFTGTWTAGSLTPQYRITGTTVFMRGRVTGGTLATGAFTLPSGYRSSAQLWLPATANSAASNGTMVVQTSGVVQPQTGSATQFQIDACFSTI